MDPTMYNKSHPWFRKRTLIKVILTLKLKLNCAQQKKKNVRTIIWTKCFG